MNSIKPSQKLSVPVLVSVLLLVVLGGAFVFELLSFDPRASQEQAAAADYEARAAALLPLGDPARGDSLIETQGCYACHRVGAVNGIAPSFEGIADRAGERKSGMSAPAYLYESIMYPTAYIVDGFSPAMPQNYPAVLSDQDMADLLAYLTSPDAR
jgi:cytochrome c551/c552